MLTACGGDLGFFFSLSFRFEKIVAAIWGLLVDLVVAFTKVMVALHSTTLILDRVGQCLVVMVLVVSGGRGGVSVGRG